MNPTNKQVAVVTGAARRIGAAIARHLHQAGYRVVIHCHRSLTEAHQLADELNQQRANSAYVIQQDLCAEDAGNRLITALIAWAERLDLLINNASVFIRTPSIEFAEQAWNELFNANLKVPLLLSLAAHPYLLQTQGAIINITDIHADTPLKGYSLYCQSKAALVMQTKSLALEFAPQIRVNGVAPGAIIWPEQANQLAVEVQQEIIEKTPLKRHGEPLYIAQAVLALAQNTFVTGQILNVDGGRSI